MLPKLWKIYPKKYIHPEEVIEGQVFIYEYVCIIGLKRQHSLGWIAGFGTEGIYHHLMWAQVK